MLALREVLNWEQDSTNTIHAFSTFLKWLTHTPVRTVLNWIRNTSKIVIPAVRYVCVRYKLICHLVQGIWDTEYQLVNHSGSRKRLWMLMRKRGVDCNRWRVGLVSLTPSPIPTNSITFCTQILILCFHLLTGIHCWLILKFFINNFQILMDIKSVGETKRIYHRLMRLPQFSKETCRMWMIKV